MLAFRQAVGIYNGVFDLKMPRSLCRPQHSTTNFSLSGFLLQRGDTNEEDIEVFLTREHCKDCALLPVTTAICSSCVMTARNPSPTFRRLSLVSSRNAWMGYHPLQRRHHG